MIFDPLAPIQSMDTDRDRVERLLVSFEGFIKNQSEGLVRTMLSELEHWVDRYPILSIYDDMTMDEIYDAVSLYQPYELLDEMCEHQRTQEEILQDIDTLMPQIFIENSHLTQFEYALYRLLHENKVEYCCIYKEGTFYENELKYLRFKFKDVIEKIEFVDNTPLPVIFHDIRPTTAFIPDPAFVFGYIEEIYGDEDTDIKGVMFIILNNTDTVEMMNGEVFVYTDKYKESMTFVNENRHYGVASMFNFALQDTSDDIGSYIDNEDEDEELW